jgi:hypothetical protein
MLETSLVVECCTGAEYDLKMKIFASKLRLALQPKQGGLAKIGEQGPRPWL